MSDALDLSRLQKFSAFAELCEQEAQYWDQAFRKSESVTPVPAIYCLTEAARHARLLERIEQWANDGYVYGPSPAKAEVLRLLREEK